MITSYSTVEQSGLSSASLLHCLELNSPFSSSLLASTTIGNLILSTNDFLYEQKLTICPEPLFSYRKGNILLWHFRDIDLNLQLNENLNKIEEIRNLPSNWDGYGAPAFSDQFMNLVISIVKTLKFQPSIFPTANQSIQIEYEKTNGDYLEFEIFEDGSIKQYIEFSDGTYELKERIPQESINELIDIFYGQ